MFSSNESQEFQGKPLACVGVATKDEIEFMLLACVGAADDVGLRTVRVRRNCSPSRIDVFALLACVGAAGDDGQKGCSRASEQQAKVELEHYANRLIRSCPPTTVLESLACVAARIGGHLRKSHTVPELAGVRCSEGNE
jgi:hypothetical protein